MGRTRLLRVGVLVAIVVAIRWLGISPAWAEGATSLASCPGYVTHLRNARNYLANGDRASAAAELRQAERALDTCVRSETQDGLVAARTPTQRAS
jgi:hypothetical protein